jgi:hypothetical protein
MRKYFYSDGKEKHGPLTFDELVHEKSVSINTLVWFEGLSDWTRAIEIDEIKSFLENRPPDVLDKNDNPSQKIKGDPDITVKSEFKVASQGWIIAGFIFSFLGGWIGLAIGINYVKGKYNKDTKQFGWIMIIISLVVRAVLAGM